MNTFLTPFIKTTSNTKYFYIELVGSNNIIYEKTNFLNYEDNTNCIYLTNNYMVLETNELKEEHIFSFSAENILAPRLKCIICLLDKNFNCIKSVFLDYLFSLKTHKFKYKIVDGQLTPNYTNLFKSFFYKDFNKKTNNSVNITNKNIINTQKPANNNIVLNKKNSNIIQRRPFGMRFT